MGFKRDRDRIPADQLTAYERWELPLLDENGNEVPYSREEDRSVKPLTAADMEAIRQEAREDGFREGREAGFQQGFDEGKQAGREAGHAEGFQTGQEEGRSQAQEQTHQEVSERLTRLEQVMEALVDPIRRHEDEVETALFNVATVLARAVVFRELQMDSSQIRAVVRDALESLPSTRDNVRIAVHPDDVAWTREVAERFEMDSRVIEDDQILPGGCRVQTRHSLVDFTIEKRFQKAVQRMLDQQLTSEEPGDGAELDAMMDDLTDFHRDVLQQDDDTSGASDDDAPPAPDAEEGDDEQQPG
ncbi:flagellar assembly protein FliH [Tamilnaduibacter salinus]|uniref:Flagellar assembly protein FliH n=1 Tax=Tamilnaduibacter salinus TaxID=1484056 RepID=A0A2A2I6L7_9GAMM|nr:flagellar assembly protein FliH [Tamilnaduibacter salinus]PAV27379.1 flagellar assembly protein FliH [Tamilnaduibacter salinus]